MDRLGYNWGPMLAQPAFACMWPFLSLGVGDSVVEFIEEETPIADRFVCEIDIEALREQTILGERTG